MERIGEAGALDPEVPDEPLVLCEEGDRKRAAAVLAVDEADAVGRLGAGWSGEGEGLLPRGVVPRP